MFFSVYILIIYVFALSEFSNERLRVERRANYYKTRSKQIFNDSFGIYIEWITKAGDFYKNYC